MQKLRLDPDDLKVESFDCTWTGGEGKGTVFGREVSYGCNTSPDNCLYTKYDTCDMDTCAPTCQGHTCEWITCGDCNTSTC